MADTPKVVRLTVEWDDGFSVEHIGADAQAVWDLTLLVREVRPATTNVVSHMNIAPPIDYTYTPLRITPITARVLTPAREVPNGQ